MVSLEGNRADKVLEQIRRNAEPNAAASVLGRHHRPLRIPVHAHLGRSQQRVSVIIQVDRRTRASVS